jgi:hypothetical protein
VKKRLNIINKTQNVKELVDRLKEDQSTDLISDMVRFKENENKSNEQPKNNIPLSANHVSYVMHKWEQPLSGKTYFGDRATKHNEVTIKVHSNPLQNINQLKAIYDVNSLTKNNGYKNFSKTNNNVDLQ